MNRKGSLKDSAEYRASLKSMDTEERIDLAFYRPMGYAWACLARKLGIGPNAITIASIFLGVGAGVAFYFPSMAINILGILLLVWANTFDSADGQLARMTGQYSRLGRILDGMAGDFWFVAIYIAICLRTNDTSAAFAAHPWLIWTIAVVAGACHANQASMADCYRQFHLYFLAERRSELENSENLRERLDAMSWSKAPLGKLILWFYYIYTRRQEILTPRMQTLRRQLRQSFPDGDMPPAFRREFRMMDLPLMKYANILTFNWRSIALFAAVLAGAPWLYFFFELVVLNGILLYMVYCHERNCTLLISQLKNGKWNNN